MMNKLSGFLSRFRIGLLQSQSRARILLLAVMIVLLVLVGARFFAGIYEGYAQKIQNEIDMKMTRYNRLSRLLADADRYRQEHSTLVEFKNNYVDSGLIQASTPALAEAQLQNVVDELADQSNLNVLSMRMLPRSQEGDITNLKIGINCRGEIGAIKDFLQRVSNQDKFLFVDQIQIQILNQREKRYYNFNAQLIAWTKS